MAQPQQQQLVEVLKINKPIVITIPDEKSFIVKFGDNKPELIILISIVEFDVKNYSQLMDLINRYASVEMSPNKDAAAHAAAEAIKDYASADAAATAAFNADAVNAAAFNAAFSAQYHERETATVVKRRNALTTIVYPHNPLDAIGWHGDLAPVRLNWRDIRPLMSARYHVPPSAHTTFLAGRLVICTFCPRPIESDPGALKLPYFHSNDDYDEFLFYHKGQFFSRDNIHPGMSSWHPSGFPHGPHPKAYDTAMQHARKETDEVAVMVDTRDFLDAQEIEPGVEFEGYADSWKRKD